MTNIRVAIISACVILVVAVAVLAVNPPGNTGAQEAPAVQASAAPTEAVAATVPATVPPEQIPLVIQVENPLEEYDGGITPLGDPLELLSGSIDYTGSFVGKRWMVPIQADFTISDHYGMRMHPILLEERMHDGLDMACPAGTEVYASRGGTVQEAGWSDSCGWYVLIDHGDSYRSIYMHMTHFRVVEGQKVEPGQVIGYVGSTGRSTGDHLHFGVYYGGMIIDPETLLDLD